MSIFCIKKQCLTVNLSILRDQLSPAHTERTLMRMCEGRYFHARNTAAPEVLRREMNTKESSVSGIKAVTTVHRSVEYPAAELFSQLFVALKPNAQIFVFFSEVECEIDHVKNP